MTSPAAIEGTFLISITTGDSSAFCCGRPFAQGCHRSCLVGLESVLVLLLGMPLPGALLLQLRPCGFFSSSISLPLLRDNCDLLYSYELIAV